MSGSATTEKCQEYTRSFTHAGEPRARVFPNSPALPGAIVWVIGCRFAFSRPHQDLQLCQHGTLCLRAELFLVGLLQALWLQGALAAL
jgi:hypothetical protein